MDRPDSERHRIFLDVGWSIVVGPFKFLVPIIGYAIFYPLILQKFGMEVLGLWSLMATVFAYFTLADVGFSQLLAREAGHDVSNDRLAHVRCDFGAAQRAYLAICVAGLTMLISLAFFDHRAFSFVSHVYDADGLFVSMAILVVASVVKLSSKLQAAVLAALNDNAFIHIVLAITPIATFGIALVGTLLGRPIEGFALGHLLSNVSEACLYQWRLWARHPRWQAVRQPISCSDTIRRVKGLVQRGFFLYTVSLGGAIRDPIFRFAIGIVFGFSGVGVYDIGMRLTRTTREIIATGFQVLYPTLAYFSRVKDRQNAAKVMRLSLIVLLAAGFGALGTIIAFAEPIYIVWLEDVPAGLVGTTKILALWNILTIANIPFWFLLQVSGHERIAALALWLHTGAVLLFLVPLASLLTLNLEDMMVLWTVTALVTQAIIYYSCHHKLGMLYVVIGDVRIGIVMFTGTLFTIVMFSLPSIDNQDGELMGGLALLSNFVASAGVYLAVVIPVMWTSWRIFSPSLPLLPTAKN